MSTKNRPAKITPTVKVFPAGFVVNESRIIITFPHSGKRVEIIAQDTFGPELGHGPATPSLRLYDVDPGVYVSIAQNVPTNGGLSASEPATDAARRLA